MIISKKSTLTGVINAMDLDISEEQYLRYEARCEAVQNIFFNLNAEQREFLITGTTSEEWNAAFGTEI